MQDGKAVGSTIPETLDRAAARLWLAGMAMQAMIIKGAGGSVSDAVLMADEMLKELDK